MLHCRAPDIHVLDGSDATQSAEDRRRHAAAANKGDSFGVGTAEVTSGKTGAGREAKIARGQVHDRQGLPGFRVEEDCQVTSADAEVPDAEHPTPDHA